MNKLFIFAVICLLSVLQCPCYCNVGKIPERSGPLWVNEPIMTTGISVNGWPVDNVSEFDPSVKLLYCFVSIKGPEHVKIGFRWYREDELLYDSGFIDLGTARRGWCAMRTAADAFEEGDYRVEIYLIRDPVKVKCFSIRKR